MRRTKIVCTLGPAVDAPAQLDRLVEAGMDVARLNFSHGTHEQHAARFAAVRAAAERAGRHIAVLQDLCGPKIRVGEMADGTVLEAGARFVLDRDPRPGDSRRAPLPVPEMFPALRPGDRLLLDDGLLELRVDEAGADEIVTNVVNGGPLGSKKGVCAPGVSLDIAAVTEKDAADARFGAELGVDYVALSFVRSAADVATLRAIIGDAVPVLVKIEKAEAVADLEAILRAADGAMVARGDLGVELPLERIPAAQKTIIHACNRLGKPVITATQMLDSMIQRPRPTRAEVTDIANAILDGTDALMLSGETAVGAYPIESVRTMARIAEETESGIDYVRLLAETHQIHGRESVTDAVADAAATIAQDQGAAAIVCGTAMGGTARSVAKFRPGAPILAATDNLTTCRRLALIRGVLPILVPPIRDTDSLLESALLAAETSGIARPGDLIVITAGTPVGVPGSTNLIKVHTIGSRL